MQNKDVKNANQSSVGSQSQQQQKGTGSDLNKNPAQKPGSSSSRVDKSDDNFGTSQSSRSNK